MLSILCSRINMQTREILDDASLSDHQRFLKIYDHIRQSNNIVADCFDDWRRSNIELKLLHLRMNRILTDEHMRGMSDGLQSRIRNVERIMIPDEADCKGGD